MKILSVLFAFSFASIAFADRQDTSKYDPTSKAAEAKSGSDSKPKDEKKHSCVEEHLHHYNHECCHSHSVGEAALHGVVRGFSRGFAEGIVSGMFR